MKPIKSIIIGIFFSIQLIYSLNAQTESLESVKSEINKAAMEEQNAFKNGDCDRVLNFMETDITFLANGHKTQSKKMIEKFCKSIPRPFKDSLLDSLNIYPLTLDTGYAVRTLEYMNDDGTKTQEYVTKIWRKNDGRWKIAHLHSTVKKIPLSE